LAADGIGGWSLQRQVVATSSQACPVSGWANDSGADALLIGNAPASSPRGGSFELSQRSLALNECYRWVLTAKDNVGNVATTTTSANLAVLPIPNPPVVTATNVNAAIYQDPATPNAIVFFRPAAATTLTLTSTGTPTDAASGSTFGALGAVASFCGPASGLAGWSPTGASSLIAGNPAARNYTFGADARDATLGVMYTNLQGQSRARAVHLCYDNVAPVASFAALPDGATVIRGVDSNPYNLAWSESDTSRVGGTTALGSGVAGRSLQRQVAALAADGSCGTFGNDGSATSAASPLSVSGLTTNCYRWVQTLVDRVGNQVDSTSGTLKVDLANPVIDPSAGLTLAGVTLTGSTSTSQTARRDIGVTVQATDVGTGVASVRYQLTLANGADPYTGTWKVGALAGINLGAWSDWLAWTGNPYNGSVAATLRLPAHLYQNLPTTYTVTVQVKDAADNASNTPSAPMTLTSLIVAPTPGAEAIIVDCADPGDPTKWQYNLTAVLYWPVGQPICVIPSARQLTPGSDQTDADHPLTGQGLILGYQLNAGAAGAPQTMYWNRTLNGGDGGWSTLGGTFHDTSPRPLGCTDTAGGTGTLDPTACSSQNVTVTHGPHSNDSGLSP
jgi:hypothetical protein